jgi:hypothetical protein
MYFSKIWFKQQNDTDFVGSIKEVLIKMGAFEEMGYDTHKIDTFVLETIMTLEELLRTKILEQV